MKVLTIVGARPQFIKAAPVSQELRAAGCHEFLVHTGQHYDYTMSQIFFDELGILQPDINLEVGSGSHGWQTGQMLLRLEEVMLAQQPDVVVVYGDTNSTLAGALAAVKLHIPVAHVEAGLRSYNRTMPEEHNRVLTDHCADVLFCPTQTAVDNLAREGITRGVYLVGDTMYDAVVQFGALARQRSRILERLDLVPQQYLLVTVHRPSNTDNIENLRAIVSALIECGKVVVFPIHPRTLARLVDSNIISQLQSAPNIHLIEPVGYFDMLMLEQHAWTILTDSGGVQKEAYFFSVPCITLREETEWIETVASGLNVLVGANTNRIIEAISCIESGAYQVKPIFGKGEASQKIAQILLSYGSERYK